MATGARPGSAFTRSPRRTATMSPSATTSGWPGTVRSASTTSRPARSSPPPPACAEAPARLDGVTPAAQITVRAACCSKPPSGVRIVTAPSSISVTVCSSSGVTPRALERAGRARRQRPREAGQDAPAGSTSSTRAAAETARWKSRRVSRAISAIWPANGWIALGAGGLTNSVFTPRVLIARDALTSGQVPG